MKLVADELNDNRAERQESQRVTERDYRVEDKVSDDPAGGIRKSACKRKIAAHLNDYVGNYVFDSDRQCLEGLQKSSKMPPRVCHGCRVCRVTFSSAADLRRHERSAVHRARERGETTNRGRVVAWQPVKREWNAQKDRPGDREVIAAFCRVT